MLTDCLESIHVNLATHGDTRYCIMIMEHSVKSIEIVREAACSMIPFEIGRFLNGKPIAGDLSHKNGFTGTSLQPPASGGGNSAGGSTYPYGTLC